MNLIKRYKFALAMFGITVAICLVKPDKTVPIVGNVTANFTEMLSILPPIFLLLGLMDVWVPRETFVKYMGRDSGIVGVTLAVLLGAFAAGPLYGAFPVASMMLRKGVSLTNVMVLLGAWSTLKIPQILFETASLGARFSVARMAANIPVIFVIAYAVNAVLSPREKEEIIKNQFQIEATLNRKATRTHG